MGVGRGALPLWILKLLAKNVVFSILRLKTKFHHFWPPLEKGLGKFLTAPSAKNPCDAHGRTPN